MIKEAGALLDISHIVFRKAYSCLHNAVQYMRFDEEKDYLAGVKKMAFIFIFQFFGGGDLGPYQRVWKKKFGHLI